MKTQAIHLDTRKIVLGGVLVAALAFMGAHARTYAAAGACTAPSTDYGTVTSTVSITGAGTYRVWTRLAAPDSTNNTIMLQVDTASCYTIGGSTVPVFTSTQDTNGNRFASGSTNWFAKDTTGNYIDVSLTTGSHTFKLIGNAPGVVVDRVVLTQDTSCVPTGTGDNCANPPDTTKPVVSITSPTNGATVAAKPTITANATDDVAVQSVDFYVDGAKVGTDTTASSNSYSYTLTTALSAGSHSMYAIATDTSGNTQQSSTVTVTVADTTPPTISAVTVSSTSQSGATITWTTNEAADSQVNYGATSSYGSHSTLDSTLVTSHSVTLSGLTASTTYHYQVVSKDASSNSASSSDATFTTQAASGDTTAPTVSITAPTGGSTLKGTSTFTVTASDNVGVVGVQYKLDGTNIGSESTTSPFSLTWTPTVYSGTHTLTAVARDAAGNTKTSASVSITITVQAADINVDGKVDYLDLSALASNYGKSGSAITIPRADITNTDGLNIVNYLDLSALASKYGS